MKRILLVLIISVFFNPGHIWSQCTGGSAGATITPGAAWSSAGTAAVTSGTYYSFVATSGYTYYFSFCLADGGNSIYDTQLTILNNSGTYAGGYSDDFCGLQSYIAWVCPSNGTYRVLVSQYNCLTNGTVLGTMVYRSQAPLTCPSGLGTGVVNVSSLPYNSGAGTTCGAVDNITSTNSLVCGSSLYYTGEDQVFIFTPSVTGTVTITLTSSGTYTGLMLYQGCPLNGAGGSCVDYAQSSTGNKSLTVCLTGGATYYLVLDSWSTPVCNPYSSLTISAPVPAGACNVGTGLVNVASLPYSSSGRTTCGKVDDLTATNTITCGSTSYFGAEDEVFQFVPTASGTITITETSTSSWVGIMLYQGCPSVAGCSGSPGTCIGYSQSSDGNQNLCANVVSGQTYYLVVDQFPSPYCIPSYNISISAPAGAALGTTCGNSYLIPALPFSLINETTSCMGNDYTNASTGSCGTFYESGEDKVYRYVASGSECIGITLTGVSSASIGYQVYSGCPGTAGTVCIANNGGATSGSLTGSAVLPSAGTYYIIVDSWAPPNSVSYNISITSYGGGPSNDLPCNAWPLSLGVYSQGNNNCSGFSGEPAAPACWVTPNTLNTVWYSVTASSAGQLRVRISPGSLSNSQIAVYSGTCSSLTEIACNDDGAACGTTLNYNSDLTFSVTAGTTYFVRVDGYNSFTGSFGIIAIDPASQTLPLSYGQECSVPTPVCNASINVGDPGWQAFGNYCDFPGGGTNCLLSGERGSAFYQINISANGTFAFDIVPNDWPGAPSTVCTDYDFALWRTTGSGATNCSAIASGAAPLRCNYSFLGVTGCYTTAGTSPPAYPGFGAAYDASLPVSAGDVLLLVVSNFSNSTSGFTMNFGASPVNYGLTGNAVTWSGGVDNDWKKPVNWGGCAKPSCSIDAVIVPSSVNQPVIATNDTVKNLTISAGASLTLNAGVTLTVCGDYNNYGTLIASSTSTIQFTNPSTIQNINGSLVGGNRFPNILINKAAGSVLLNQDIDIAGNFTTANATSIFNTNGKYIKLAGNFSNNNANTTFSNVNGTLEFNGVAGQTFMNTNGVLTLKNVVMNHSGTGVTLSGANSNMNIGTSGVLTLTNGKIITGSTNEVNVTNTASGALTGGNATSFVDGFLRRWLNGSATSYDFPVGTSAKGFQKANVNFTSSTTIQNLLASFSAYGALPGPLMLTECGYQYNQNALNHGFWTITASNNPTSGNYNLTLYNQNFTNGQLFYSVMKRSNSVSAWSLNGTCVWPCSINAVQRNGMNGFSDFGIPQSNSPLPIELLNFSAEPLSAEVITKWTTSSEINNNYFVLQRSNTTTQFEDIGQIDGAGNSNVQINYLYYDKHPFPGINYYRLKQVDYDEHWSLSKVIAVHFNREKGFIYVSPNPVKDKLTVSFSSEKGNYEINLTDVTGKQVLKKGVWTTEGITTLDLDLNGIAPAIYFLTILSEEDLVQVKVAKE